MERDITVWINDDLYSSRPKFEVKEHIRFLDDSDRCRRYGSRRQPANSTHIEITWNDEKIPIKPGNICYRPIPSTNIEKCWAPIRCNSISDITKYRAPICPTTTSTVDIPAHWSFDRVVRHHERLFNDAVRAANREFGLPHETSNHISIPTTLKPGETYEYYERHTYTYTENRS